VTGKAASPNSAKGGAETSSRFGSKEFQASVPPGFIMIDRAFSFSLFLLSCFFFFFFPPDDVRNTDGQNSRRSAGTLLCQQDAIKNTKARRSGLVVHSWKAKLEGTHKTARAAPWTQCLRWRDHQLFARSKYEDIIPFLGSGKERVRARGGAK